MRSAGNVSIRARPHGRAMPTSRRVRWAWTGFNPRPASRSGDATRPARLRHKQLVSIRARPHGRAMLRGSAWMARPLAFQSAPGLTVGRCFRYGLFRGRCWFCFNPRPASRSGDARLHFAAMRARDVSIRARPHGRAMQRHQQHAGAQVEVSIRARPHGRAMHELYASVQQGVQFQSAPGLTVGRCRSPRPPGRPNCSFNPRPASRSGDAAQQPHPPPLRHWKFQSAPGLTVGRCRIAASRL